MDINVYLFIVIALMLLIIMYLLFVLRACADTACADKRRLRGYKGREFEPTYFSRRKRYDKNNLL